MICHNMLRTRPERFSGECWYDCMTIERPTL